MGQGALKWDWLSGSYVFLIARSAISDQLVFERCADGRRWSNPFKLISAGLLSARYHFFGLVDLDLAVSASFVHYLLHIKLTTDLLIPKSLSNTRLACWKLGWEYGISLNRRCSDSAVRHNSLIHILQQSLHWVCLLQSLKWASMSFHFAQTATNIHRSPAIGQIP